LTLHCADRVVDVAIRRDQHDRWRRAAQAIEDLKAIAILEVHIGHEGIYILLLQ
jgi:hypothetical protein